MKGICTKVSDAAIQTHLANIAIEDDDDSALMDEIVRVTTTFKKAPIAKLWVWMDLPEEACDSSGIQVVAMNASDYIFLQVLKHTSMLIQKDYTPSSIIRMTITDRVVRVWWVDPYRKQDATVIAIFDGGWVLAAEQHRWLWSCIMEEQKEWLRKSYQQLTKMSGNGNR